MMSESSNELFGKFELKSCDKHNRLLSSENLIAGIIFLINNRTPIDI